MKINNIKCDTYPLRENCMKDLCRRVFPLSVSIDYCPFCGKPLVKKYVYTVPVSEDECVKVCGKACISCDAFFSMCKALLEGLEKVRTSREQYHYDTRFLKTINYTYYHSLLNKGTAYKQYTLLTPKVIMLKTIVEDEAEEDIERGILHKTNGFATKLRKAEEKGERVVTYKGEKYVIDRVRERVLQEGAKPDVVRDSPEQTIDNIPREISSDTTLYVYNGNIGCHRTHHLVDLKACIPTMDGEKRFWIQYCIECGKYLMKHDDYMAYLKRFKFFPMRLERDMASYHYCDYSDLAEYSPLKLYGYTTVDLSKEDRQSLLAHIMDYRYMEKRKIANYLEQFIRRGTDNPAHLFAVPCWEEDLEYVLNYRLNEKPEVLIGKIEKRRS